MAERVPGNDYEVLASRARELLAKRPRPGTEDVADQILWEIADEFGVPADRWGSFTARLRPAMVGVVSTVRSHLVRDQVTESVRPYLAKALPSVAAPASAASMPRLLTPAATLGDGQTMRDTQVRLAVPEPTPERTGSDHPLVEIQNVSVAPSAPEPAEAAAKPKPEPPAPDSPLSRRMEVLDGFRALRDEVLFVPGFADITYGTATLKHWHRRLQWRHDQARGHVDGARDERRILNLIEATPGATCLNDVLKGGPLAEGES